MKKLLIFAAFGLLFTQTVFSQDLEIKDNNITSYINCTHGIKVFKQTVKWANRPYTFYCHTYYPFETDVTFNEIPNLEGVAYSLYAVDGNGNPETLISVITPHLGEYSSNYRDIEKYTSNSRYCDFVVLPGTKRIAKGAFLHCFDILSIHLPSSIQFIPESWTSGLSDYICNIDVYDENSPLAITAEEVSPESLRELAHYNLQGMKVNENARGVQIVQYNDGSARKVVVK